MPSTDPRPFDVICVYLRYPLAYHQAFAPPTNSGICSCLSSLGQLEVEDAARAGDALAFDPHLSAQAFYDPPHDRQAQPMSSGPRLIQPSVRREQTRLVLGGDPIAIVTNPEADPLAGLDKQGRCAPIAFLDHGTKRRR